MTQKHRTITHAEWVAEGTKLFGPNASKWRFICPCCGHVASVEDWKKAGAAEECVAFSCIGRFLKHHEPREAFGEGKGPCNYAGGGLIKLNPVTIQMPDGKEHSCFEFAPVG